MNSLLEEAFSPFCLSERSNSICVAGDRVDSPARISHFFRLRTFLFFAFTFACTFSMNCLVVGRFFSI